MKQYRNCQAQYQQGSIEMAPKTHAMPDLSLDMEGEDVSTWIQFTKEEMVEVRTML